MDMVSFSAIASAVAAFGAMLAAFFSLKVSKQSMKMSHEINEAESVKEIRSMWHQFDIAYLTGPKEFRDSINANYHEGQDAEHVYRIFIIMTLINIAQSIYHYKRLERISVEFEESQIVSIAGVLKKEEELSGRILKGHFSKDAGFYSYMIGHIEKFDKFH